ncbi:interleukin-11 [Phaenicophaeus curvirostris]|uniref:interleukin-11 n=1 Tax=Phaenicophaeus curvirostris TaxID=33595 RepID=UPI0037F0DD11
MVSGSVSRRVECVTENWEHWELRNPSLGSPGSPGAAPPRVSVPAGSPWRALLALLGLWPGLWPGPWPGLGAPPPACAPPDPRVDLDGIVSLAKALLSDTKAFLAKSRFPAEGEHKLDSLPVLSMSALELANIQAAALSRLSADLARYRSLLEWLRRGGPGAALRPLDSELAALQARLERLGRRLEHLVRDRGGRDFRDGRGFREPPGGGA